jgi:hypothetical protein
MRRVFIFIAAICSFATVFAQTEADTAKVKAWKLSGSAGFDFSQTSLSNWSGGGDDAINGRAYLNAGLDYKKGNWLWQNSLATEFGMTYTKTDKTRKSVDRLDLATQIGYTTDNRWYYSAMADFKTQYAKGYNYPNTDLYISRFMAPATSTVSVGIEYKPEDKFYSFYFSPLAAKLTFVRDDSLSHAGAFGVDVDKKFRAELGAYLKAKCQKDLMENVKLISDANFFTAYDKSFGNIDVEWNLLLSMKINKYLNANVSTTLKYDDDVKYVDTDGITRGPRVQFKEIFGIGLGYNF